MVLDSSDWLAKVARAKLFIYSIVYFLLTISLSRNPLEKKHQEQQFQSFALFCLEVFNVANSQGLPWAELILPRITRKASPIAACIVAIQTNQSLLHSLLGFHADCCWMRERYCRSMCAVPSDSCHSVCPLRVWLGHQPTQGGFLPPVLVELLLSLFFFFWSCSSTSPEAFLSRTIIRTEERLPLFRNL